MPHTVLSEWIKAMVRIKKELDKMQVAFLWAGCENERWRWFLLNRNSIPTSRMHYSLMRRDEEHYYIINSWQKCSHVFPNPTTKLKQKKKYCRRMMCFWGKKRNELICTNVRWLDDNIHSMILSLPSSARYACCMLRTACRYTFVSGELQFGICFNHAFVLF